MNSYSVSSLLDYRETIFKLSGWIRQLKDTADSLALSTVALSTQEMLQRVETSAFSIAVVGEFKRGKSTLINALLGQDVLPADIAPTTATLNRIKYGIRPQVKVHFKNGQVKDIEPSELAQYATKLTQASAKTAATIKEVVVYYPVSYCREGVEILDTPGLEDEAAMTAITLSVLPHVDAAIFVVMAQSPFSKSEKAFLSEHLLAQNIGRVLFVVTGIDRCRNAESVDKIVERVKKQIKEIALQGAAAFRANTSEHQDYLSRVGQVNVIGVSAYQALQARANGDAGLLIQSRLSELERAIEALLQERGKLFLKASASRVVAVSKVVLNAIAARQAYFVQRRSALAKECEDAITLVNKATARATAAPENVFAPHQAVVTAAQQELALLFEQLKTDLQYAVRESIENISVVLVVGSQASTAEKMNGLETTIAEILENYARRWAGKLQVGLRRAIVKLPEAFRPEPEQTIEWMHSVGLYSINFGASIKQSMQQSRSDCERLRVISISHSRVEDATQTSVDLFKDSYTLRIDGIIAQQVDSTETVKQNLFNQLAMFLESTNPALWRTEKKNDWRLEQQLKLGRDETRIDLTLRDLQRLHREIQTVQSEVLALQAQVFLE